jgi:hypothetical protein
MQPGPRISTNIVPNFWAGLDANIRPTAKTSDLPTHEGSRHLHSSGERRSAHSGRLLPEPAKTSQLQSSPPYLYIPR